MFFCYKYYYGNTTATIEKVDQKNNECSYANRLVVVAIRGRYLNCYVSNVRQQKINNETHRCSLILCLQRRGKRERIEQKRDNKITEQEAQSTWAFCWLSWRNLIFQLNLHQTDKKPYLFILLSFLLKAQQDFAKKKKDLEAKYEKQLVSDLSEGGEVFSLAGNKFRGWP